ncbi:MAG: NAD-dependent succinate-semialdehyde dehydrogenase [Steroidobacteraceae bacterium]
MNSAAVQSISLRDASLLRERAFINGRWEPARDVRTIAVVNPATGGVLGSVPNMGREETRAAIDAAQAALGGWSGLTAKERSRILRRWFDLMIENQDDLATIMTLEQGKPLAESRGEIGYAASFIEWYAEEGKRAYGDIVPTHDRNKRLLVLRQPIGVCAAITPWNFPAAMITRKVGPALAAGCTMVVKPSELTPFSALALAVLAERAGLPPGVLSIVTGDAKPIGAELTGSPIVRKLSFTGSTETGKLLMARCAGTLKKVSLELGGNAPFLVFDDADLDATIAGAIASKYRNAGQTCVCANRILVQSGIHDRFVERLAAAAAALKVGDGLVAGTQIGPLIDERAIAKAERHVADAVAKGATVVTGGAKGAGAGNYFTPTVLAGVSRDALPMHEETFGPVAPVLRFETEAEAIELANATRFGLAAYLYTRDVSRVWRVSEALEFGIVGINDGIISTESAPFGGWKESGIGREGGRYGLDEYTELKYLALGGVAAG